jgi:alkylation response protein AidB-like acyl-CoA dehydrogenase
MRLLQSESESLISDAARRLFSAYSIEQRRMQWHGKWLSDAYEELAGASMLELGAFAEGDHESIGYLIAFATEIGRSALSLPFVTSSVGAAFLLQECGRDDEASQLRSGSKIYALALSEATGSLSGTLSPKAVLKGGRLQATKSAVSFAGEAEALLVCATRENGSPCLIKVGRDDHGVTLEKLDTISGDQLYQVTLACDIADDAILAEGKDYLALVREVLLRIFLTQSAILVGGAERALEIVTEHVIQRHQFGQPLGAFQAVQHHIANSRSKLDASRLMTSELGWRMGENHPDLLAWAAETKMWVSSATGEILRRAHELQGGISVTDEHETMMLSRRNLAEAVLWGSGTELLRLCYPLRNTPPTVQPLFKAA